MPIDSRSLHEICEPAASYAAATASRGLEPGWVPQVEVYAVPYAIRIPVPAGEVACPRCNHTLMDPRNYIDDHPSIRVTVSFGRKHCSLRL